MAIQQESNKASEANTNMNLLVTVGVLLLVAILVMLGALLVVFMTATASAGGDTSSQPAPTTAPVAGQPNPASVNCEEQGGTHTVETGADGGEYGVCVFEDNRQCEEFALMHG